MEICSLGTPNAHQCSHDEKVGEQLMGDVANCGRWLWYICCCVTVTQEIDHLEVHGPEEAPMQNCCGKVKKGS